MQKQENPNKEVLIQNKQLLLKLMQTSIKIPKLLEDLSFPVHNVKDDFKLSLQLSFHTIYLANIHFAQFDAQFVAMPKKHILQTSQTQCPSPPSTSYSSCSLIYLNHKAGSEGIQRSENKTILFTHPSNTCTELTIFGL